MTIIQQIIAAVEAQQLNRVRTLVSEHYSSLQKEGWIRYLMSSGALHNNLDLLKLLVELGADVNIPESEERPEGVIVEAAGVGAVEVVVWLLERGAKLNYQVDGVKRCFAVSRAAGNGRLGIVKLLVAAGADVNACWNGMNALRAAILNSHADVVSYLRSVGAQEPNESLN